MSLTCNCKEYVLYRKKKDFQNTLSHESTERQSFAFLRIQMESRPQFVQQIMKLTYLAHEVNLLIRFFNEFQIVRTKVSSCRN